MIRGHGGNIHDLARACGCRPEEILDASSNVNPLGPPEGLLEHLAARLGAVRALPEVDAGSIVAAYARRLSLAPECLLAGNGSTQLIYDLPRALRSRRALIAGPTYADYRDACRVNGVPTDWFLAEAQRGFVPDSLALERAAGGVDTVFICNPNNPTGALIPGDTLRRLCQRRPRVHFVVDESYLPFVPGGEAHSLVSACPPNAVVLHSLSKIYRLPGLRIGFAVGPPETIRHLAGFMLPWSVNALAQEAVAYLLERPEATAAFEEQSRRVLAAERERLTTALEAIGGLTVFPSVTSFLLVRLPQGMTSPELCGRLAPQGILIRDCSNFKGLSPRFVRVSLKSPTANDRLLAALTAALTGGRAEERTT
jgi:threonine-phosphate decarboxylase